MRNQGKSAAMSEPDLQKTRLKPERLQLPPDQAFDAPSEPYDESMDAMAELDAAFERAAANGRRVLVVLGASWCPDCRILAGMMEIPALKVFMDAAYETVRIPVGRYDRNMDAAARLGFSDGLEGVPAVVILAPDGLRVNADTVYDWRSARTCTPQEAADYFYTHAVVNS
jgi:thiol-disulfide isomerase/thioredoxin